MHNSWRKLSKTGVFKDTSEIADYIILKALKQGDEPLGCWALQTSLLEYKIEKSTASIGRQLKMLDVKEYTIRYKNKGRIITPAGEAWLKHIDSRIAEVERKDELSETLRVNELEDLIDLLQARKTLETEMARTAAIKATEKDIERIKISLSAHKECVEANLDPTKPALDFHDEIANSCHNKFMIAMLDMLIREERRIESVIETLVTRERGSAYIKEHEAIAKAIESRNAKLAANLMEKHIDVLCDAIEEQIEELGNISIKL